jgi:hypothetical protein
MSLRYAPKGFHEVSAADEAKLDRSTDDLCPVQAKGFLGGLSTLVRCYGCTHLFDPEGQQSDVLCPCCSR